MPAHTTDFDYYHGVGVGGQVDLDGRGGQGGGGAAVIVAQVPGVPLPARNSFFFTGKRLKHLCSCERRITDICMYWREKRLFYLLLDDALVLPPLPKWSASRPPPSPAQPPLG